MLKSNYIDSGSIKVFPSTYRINYPAGKFTSENNFVNIINSIVDYNGADGYVIDFDESVDGGRFRIVIHGYYFDFVLPKDNWKDTNIYAGIVVENHNEEKRTVGALVNFNNQSATELDSAGSTPQFQGLYLSTSEITTPTDAKFSSKQYSLYTLQIVSNGNIINTTKLSASSIKYGSGATATDMASKIDTKQDNITPDGDLSFVTEDNKLKLKLNTTDYVHYSEQKNINSAGDYLLKTDDTGHLVTVSDKTVGKKASTENNALVSQNVYLLKGQIAKGHAIYASTDSPSDSVGEVGDIWFKYSSK